MRSSKESISLKKATSIYLQQSNILPEREVEHLVATTSKNKEESQFFKSKEKIMRQSYQGSLREKMHKNLIDTSRRIKNDIKIKLVARALSSQFLNFQ